MQKFRLTLCCAALASLVLCGCVNEEFGEEQNANDAKNEFTKNWIQKYGPINPDQNWNMASLVRADVKIEALGKAASVNIYNEDPAQGGMLIGVADRDRVLNLDVVKGSKQVFAEVFADGKKLSSGYYDIANGAATINGQPSAPARAASRAANVIHEHPAFHWMLACEDLGDTFDTDFNDIVLGIYHVAGVDEVLIFPMAAGGMLETHILFKGEEVKPGASRMPRVPLELHEWLKNAPTNRILQTSSFDDTAVFASVSVSKEWNMATNYTDFSINVVGKDASTHITAPASGEAPQIICLSGEWYWPTENTRIEEAYTGFGEWSTFGEPTWIKNPVSGKYVNWAFDHVPATVTVLKAYSVYNNGETLTKTPVSTYSNLRFNGYNGPETVTVGVPFSYYTPAYSYSVMFNEYTNKPEYQIAEVDVSGLDMTRCIGLNGMFWDCDCLERVYFGDNFDTSRVKYFNGMFEQTMSITSLDQLEGFTNFDTSSAIDMRLMFDHTSIDDLDLRFFRTPNLECIESMFDHAHSTKVNLAGWNTSKINNMSWAFNMCKIGELDLTGWSVPINGCEVSAMFNDSVIETLICSQDFYNWIVAHKSGLIYNQAGKITTVKTPEGVILNTNGALILN